MSVRWEIHDASKVYGRKSALRHCEATIEPGTVAALVGTNGAGKSTLLAATVGLVRLTSGHIAIDGRRVAGRLDPSVGYLAQDKPLFRRWRVSDMLAQAGDLNERWDERRARVLIDKSGLSLDSRVGDLSGGQRTRVALALVLARRPALLLLDEPLADLDPLARIQVQQDLMTEVADTGMTVVVSSHILSEVRDSCDSLLLLQDGQITLQGGTDDLVRRHRLLNGPSEDSLDWLPVGMRVEVRRTEHQVTVLICGEPPGLPPQWTSEPVELEDVVIARMRTQHEQLDSHVGAA